MNRGVVCFISLYLILSNVLTAQNLRKIVKQADEYFKDKNYKLAQGYYKDALAIDSQDAKLNFRYGCCLLNSPTNRLALPYLQKAYHKDPKVDEYVNYLLGQAHQYNLEFH